MSKITGNLNKDWELLLSKINNIAVKMILKSVAKPIEISSEKIVILFKDKSIAQKAEAYVNTPAFKGTVQDVFNTVPEVQIIKD